MSLPTYAAVLAAVTAAAAARRTNRSGHVGLAVRPDGSWAFTRTRRATSPAAAYASRPVRRDWSAEDLQTTAGCLLADVAGQVRERSAMALPAAAD